jgi:hypothetical protein
MTWVLLTFVVTRVIYAGVLGLAFRRVALRLQGHPEAVKAVTEDVLLPLLGRTKNDAEKKKPVPRDARLC